MSYIKVMFPDNVERGLKFNNLAVSEFFKNVNWERYNDTANYAMVWAGLYGNSFAKREEPDYTFDNVMDWVDQMDKKVLDDISTVLAETQKYKDAAKVISDVMNDDTVTNETPDEKKSELTKSLATA